MDEGDTVDAYIDLRSPYSYLAISEARALAADSGVRFQWWPFITDFRSAYGGEVTQRSSRDIAKLKYLYMDCRRLAKIQGLTIRATTKLWDASLASRAMLFAKREDRLWAFCMPLLQAFWARDFDLESQKDIETALETAGLSVHRWRTYLEMDAESAMREAINRSAKQGVFGAPTFVYRDELFWGSDRLGLLSVALGVAKSPSQGHATST